MCYSIKPCLIRWAPGSLVRRSSCLIGKGVYCQAWQSAFVSLDSSVGKREPSPASFPLTSIRFGSNTHTPKWMQSKKQWLQSSRVWMGSVCTETSKMPSMVAKEGRGKVGGKVKIRQPGGPSDLGPWRKSSSEALLQIPWTSLWGCRTWAIYCRFLYYHETREAGFLFK